MPDIEKIISELNDLIYCEREYLAKIWQTEPSWIERILNDAVSLLKKQEAVKPVLDKQTGRIWLCGKCGSYVGFEDNDPHDTNEFDKYCRECGRPVLWDRR